MDTLYYFSRSKDVQAGKGTNENVIDYDKYNELNKIKNWRQILSNFYCEPFKFRENTFNSVEHAFQHFKIKLVDEEKAKYFTIESGNEIGLGTGKIAQKNRKIVRLDKNMLKIWDKIKYNLMIEITKERIKQSKLYQKVLLLTKDAQLWHIQIRKKAIRNIYLEKLRDEIKI